MMRRLRTGKSVFENVNNFFKYQATASPVELCVLSSPAVLSTFSVSETAVAQNCVLEQSYKKKIPFVYMISK